MQNGRRGVKLSAPLNIPIHPKLKDRIGRAADKEGVPMNEFVARILAEHLGCPELAKVPRHQMGRPRKELMTA